ncbi:MAG: collagen-like triple helix repeat-containing protein [Solirubrobacterales bacterium]
MLVALCAFVFAASSASARGIVAKDGKIHACYKAKGKGKGTLRVVRNGKVRCPKKWKKVSWYASGAPGSQGEQGPAGTTGPSGAPGAIVPNVDQPIESIIGLEGKVTELLKKVESLEAILKGVTNAELLAAIANTKALCSQVSTLTDQLNAVEEALGGLSLNSALTAIGGLLEIPVLPGALPAFSCPS